MIPLSFAALTLDLFLLGHAHLAAGQAGEGTQFERRVKEHLQQLGLPSGGGFRVLGRRSLSGLYHQLDEQTDCGHALVVGEWKAYRGVIPKNDLLRFKAATDDYWMATRPSERSPVMRVFGGTGHVTAAMRTYGANAGIVLITPDRWPVPVLCHPGLVWTAAGLEPPSAVDVRSMLTLVRPLNEVLSGQHDGSWRVPPSVPAGDVAHRLDIWLRHSERAWEWWDDASSARFEELLARRCRVGAYAA